MVSKGWATAFDTFEDLVAFLGTKDITLNKLGLISKMKPDGSWKHRLIWDLLRSRVNSNLWQGERVVLPRLTDLAQDVVDLSRLGDGTHSVWLFGSDVSDAFHQIPLNASEQRFTVAQFQGKFYVFKVLVFGSGSAPTVWGRYAAWLGRSSCAVLHRYPFRMETYVDDPVYAASGPKTVARRSIATALLWAVIAGFPFA